MRRQRALVGTTFAVLLAGIPHTGMAQVPVLPVNPPTGQAVYPVFEGWYKNPDGSFSISFGYFNRNTQEVVDVPIGAGNAISPGAQNQGQATRFEPRRHWGVFAVKVPADFGAKTVTWTLTVRGETYAIPGSLRADWQIDALEGEVGSGNTPPSVRFDANGPVARGPGGSVAGPQTTAVGKPLTLSVWAADDGRTPAAANPARAATNPPQTRLAWFVHQGPAGAVFSPPTADVPIAGGTATTTVTFSTPGQYVLRVRANDASGVSGAGHAQCCWTNAFVRVTVTP